MMSKRIIKRESRWTEGQNTSFFYLKWENRTRPVGSLSSQPSSLSDDIKNPHLNSTYSHIVKK